MWRAISAPRILAQLMVWSLATCYQISLVFWLSFFADAFVVHHFSISGEQLVWDIRFRQNLSDVEVEDLVSMLHDLSIVHIFPHLDDRWVWWPNSLGDFPQSSHFLFGATRVTQSLLCIHLSWLVEFLLVLSIFTRLWASMKSSLRTTFKRERIMVSTSMPRKMWITCSFVALSLLAFGVII